MAVTRRNTEAGVRAVEGEQKGLLRLADQTKGDLNLSGRSRKRKVKVRDQGRL